MITTAPRPLRPSMFEAVGWACAAFVAYTLLAQHVFYKIDGPFLVLNLDEGRCEHPYNVLYMPMVCALRELLAPLGLSAYRIAVAFSALGTALGVGIAHIAFARSGLNGSQLRQATGLFFATPAVAFFATVVEHHGPFMPFAALAFWATIELARRPTLGLAVATGLLTHVAYLVHGTGNLLPGVLLPLFLAWRRSARTLPRDCAIATVVGVVHLGLFFGLRDLELPGGGVDAALHSVLEDGIGQPRGFGYLGSVAVLEWFLPYLPVSVFGLLAVMRPSPLRLEAWALLVGLLPYLGICLLLIVGEPEFGAYLLPLGLPAVRLTVAAWPMRIGRVSCAIAAVLALVAIVRHDDVAEQDGWSAGLARAAGGVPPVLLLGGPEEIGFALAAAPAVERFVPSVAAATVRDDPEGIARLCAVFDAYVAAQRGAGKVVLFTAGGQDDVRALPAGPALLDHVVAKHAPAAIDDGPFRAWRLDR